MDVQSLINGVIIVGGGILGWSLRIVYSNAIRAITSLQKEIEKIEREDIRPLQREVHELDKLVVGDYLKRKEFNEIVQTLFEKLDSISGKLDKKADKRSTD